MRGRFYNGFTIVEIVIVITIVAILSSITIITYTGIRQDSRDNTRQGNVTIISEALEKYYEKHGEYPSITSIVKEQTSNTGPAVASKLSIPAESLVMPATPSSVTNALTSNPNPDGDYIVYASEDTNSTCQFIANGGCDEYSLKYLKEASGNVVEIKSRHASREPGVGAPELEVSALDMSTIESSWSEFTSATGYELQYSTSNTLSSPVTTEHTSTTATSSSLMPNTEYYFRVRAVLPTSFSDWSDIKSSATSSLPVATGTITVAATMVNSTTARGTAGGTSTCPGGSNRVIQIRHQINTGTWSAWTEGTVRDVAATEGYQYTFQSRVACEYEGLYGPWKTSTTAAVIRPVTAPSGLTISAAIVSTSYARGTAGGGSCSAGTTIQRQMQYYVNAGSWSAWSTRSVWDIAATSGYRYTYRQQSRCAGSYASSAWVVSGTDTVVRPVTAPSGLTISAAIVSTSYARGTAGGGSCPAGTTIERQIRYSGRNDTATSYVAWSTRSVYDVAANQGWRYIFQQQARCVGSYASSGFVASSTASTVRSITSKPTGGSATASTPSGSSYTTFSISGIAGCPTGTTVLYTYRYTSVAGSIYPPDWTAGHPSYNNPPHNWANQLPASTAYRTFVWNTSSRNRNYFVHFAAMCGTTHHTGPWIDSQLSHAASYYRP